jgi:hypothetical protein
VIDEHARVHASSPFVQEREAIAIEALAALGRHTEARARFVRFGERYPESTYRRRLSALLDREPQSISP